MPITLLDGILVGFTLVSAMLAMVRGFSREFLSIASWIAAGAAGLFFYPLMLPYVDPYIDQPDLAMWASAAVVFIVVLIVVTIITMKIADIIIDSSVGALDRTLGFIYGAARGILVVAVALMLFIWLTGTNQVSWISEAKSRPMLEQIGNSLMGALDEVISWGKVKIKENPENPFLKPFLSDTDNDTPATDSGSEALPPATDVPATPPAEGTGN